MSSNSAFIYETSDLLRSIPRPEYPIHVFTGAPDPFSLDSQRKFMRWSHERGYLLPDSNCLNGPSTEGIKETVWPFIERFGCKPDPIVNPFFSIHARPLITSVKIAQGAMDVASRKAANCADAISSARPADNKEIFRVE